MITRAPNDLASWIAVVPMPDEPPWTSSVSPAFNRPRSKALCQTVKKVSGIAAAATSVRPGGTSSAWLSCAENCPAHESHALLVPPGLTLVAAAAIPETFFTVWHNAFARGRLNAGDTLLVHGG